MEVSEFAESFLKNAGLAVFRGRLPRTVFDSEETVRARPKNRCCDRGKR